MFAIRRSLSALTFAASMIAAPAFAMDAPVVTADAADPGVAAQIDEYLRTSPAVALPKDAAAGITSSEDEGPRKVHGVVDVAVGTHGYRSAYVRSDFPVGKTGTLSIAVQDTQFNGRGGGYRYGGYGYGGGPYGNQNVALGLSFGGAGQDTDARCRNALGSGRHRLDPGLLGSQGAGPGDDRPYACDRTERLPERPLD